jgi:hypothetical protein
MKKIEALSIRSVVLTVADADCMFHPCYFSTISKDFNTLREAPEGDQMWCMWQAPQLSYRDHWKAPLPSRIWTYVSSMYEFGGTSSLYWGGHHMVFSGYSLPLQLAIDGKSWDGDVIAEDHHCYIKNLFYSAHYSAVSAQRPDACDRWSDGCQPKLQVRPIFLPVKSSPVISSQGYWQTYVERWHQAKRHAQGVAEFPYALLVCWDLVCTLPMRSWSLALVYKMTRVLMRLWCMHVLPVCQGLSLGVITMYWLANKQQLHLCPNDAILHTKHLEDSFDYLLCALAGAWTLVWPIVIPFVLVVLANYLFVLTAFLQPASAESAEKFSWNREDGALPTWCGSKRFATLLIIAIDIPCFLSIMMIPYGLIACLLSYWHVCFYGNRFNYITAAKAAKESGELQYGTMKEAP